MKVLFPTVSREQIIGEGDTKTDDVIDMTVEALHSRLKKEQQGLTTEEEHTKLFWISGRWFVWSPVCIITNRRGKERRSIQSRHLTVSLLIKRQLSSTLPIAATMLWRNLAEHSFYTLVGDHLHRSTNRKTTRKPFSMNCMKRGWITKRRRSAN